MMVIDNTVISDELADSYFICDLQKCKGACCREGDLGAPLEAEELGIIESVLDQVKPYLSEQGKKEIKKQGAYIKDYEGDFSTPTIKGKECAYAIGDKNGILNCGFELAFRDGKTGFRKPVSCHLYPVRVTHNSMGLNINYHQWHICKPACQLGKSQKVPLYLFLKDALIRKFGKEWYDKLTRIINTPR